MGFLEVLPCLLEVLPFLLKVLMCLLEVLPCLLQVLWVLSWLLEVLLCLLWVLWVLWVQPCLLGVPSPLQQADLPRVRPRRHVDAVVGQHHQQEGDVKGHHGAGDGVGLVHHEDAVGGVGGLVELPLLDLR